MILCYDSFDFETERNTIYYVLVGTNLVVHTYVLDGITHTNRQWCCKLTNAIIKHLLSLTEEQRLNYMLRNQLWLHQTAIYDKEI